MYKARPFGQDCLGNSTGYLVERYVDGVREVVGTFVANIYEPGSFGRAKSDAEHLARTLNDRRA